MWYCLLGISVLDKDSGLTNECRINGFSRSLFASLQYNFAVHKAQV
jgi:hypothetical protein